MSALGFGEFAGRFAEEFGLTDDELPVTEATRLVEDLGFDSLDLFRLSMFLDVIGEVTVPEDLEALMDFTLGDVHYYYRTQIEQQGRG